MAVFRASARSIDMLGRQQIASIPTALSELYKNGFDAYARQLQVDYVPDRSALLLRDDGVGMSPDDFSRRWLTLGTDSKAANGTQPRPPRPDGVRVRPTMGEKGIGRLAIASIGPQVLVITRARPTSGVPGPLTAALVQWTLFEIPGLLIDDVEVPVVRLDEPAEARDPGLPGRLAESVRSSLHRLDQQGRVPKHLRDRIAQELDQLHTPIAPLLRLSGPDPLADDGHGTLFLVTPLADELASVMEPSTLQQQEDSATEFERLLIGFNNTMLPRLRPPEMRASFVVHRPGKADEDLLDSKRFFSPGDFARVDHDIEGEFDDTGRFQGTVRVYDREVRQHTVLWNDGKGRLPRCGPFKIRIGYLQGDPKESHLDSDTYAAMNAKLRRIGGIYVYRDGIRVLPYGSGEVDYLGIEERRSRNAGRYYFSYRRMFGAIEISTEDNPRLRDKASREGLLDNVAYRDFRSILVSFLVQTAADFFRPGGEDSQEFLQQKARLRKDDADRRRLEQRLAARRAKYAEELGDRLDFLSSGRAAAELDAIVGGLRDYLRTRTSRGSLAESEAQAREAVEDVVARAVLEEPPGLGLDEDQARTSLVYRNHLDRFLADSVPAASARIVGAIEERAAGTPEAERQILHDARRRAFDEASDRLRVRLGEQAAAARKELNSLRRFVDEAVDGFIGAYEQAVSQAGEALRRSSGPSEQDTAIRSVDAAARQQGAAIDTLRASLVSLREGGGEESRLLQQRLLAVEAEMQINVEMLLLGQAVQVIDHELEASVTVARDSLSSLAGWAKRSPRAAEALTDATTAFEHLDGYLRLFTPLQRRLRRKRTRVTGERIALYLERVFAHRLDNGQSRLEATRAFRSASALGFASTFLPVFVNLVDNALYWASVSHPSGGAAVVLDADGLDLLVRDNGPGVPGQDREVVFQRHFSRRTGGRGLGLSISRTALGLEGWDLVLDPPGEKPGACFRLTHIAEEEDEDE